MKHINKLTNQEILEYYKNNLLEPEGKIKKSKITRTETEIELYTIAEVPEFEEDLKSEQETTEIEDLITFTDYNIIECRVQRKATKKYREFMYKRFGIQYAEDYLFGN